MAVDEGELAAVATWLHTNRPFSCIIIAEGAHMLRLIHESPPPDQAQRAPSIL